MTFLLESTNHSFPSSTFLQSLTSPVVLSNPRHVQDSITDPGPAASIQTDKTIEKEEGPLPQTWKEPQHVFFPSAQMISLQQAKEVDLLL